MSKRSTWKTLTSKTVYENRWIRVRHDQFLSPGGVSGIYGVVDGMSFALVIPKVGDKFYLVKTYRYPIGKFSIEFPAGGIEENESIEGTARRELEEEAGLISDTFTKLGFLYTSNGFSTIGCHIFLAEDCAEVERKPEQNEEEMTVQKVRYPELVKLITTNKITDGPTVAAFCLYQQQLGM